MSEVQSPKAKARRVSFSLMALVTGENPRSAWGMSRDAPARLAAFEHLSADEKRAFTAQGLRRWLPFDSGPLEDEGVGAAAAALFESLSLPEAGRLPGAGRYHVPHG